MNYVIYKVMAKYILNGMRSSLIEKNISLNFTLF